jgi:MT0933-like antitoxin protein
MPDFSEFADEAKKLASEHPEQADQAFDKAADFANQQTGNRFDSEVQRGEQAGENYMGIQDQDQQGQQQSQGQGGYDQGQGGGQGGYDQNQDQGGGQYGDQGQGDQYGQNQGGGQY